MKTLLRKRVDRIDLVLVDPAKSSSEYDTVAGMTRYEGLDCWTLVDIRLSLHIQPSPYAASPVAEYMHTYFKPPSECAAAQIKAQLREYQEDSDGTLRWCPFEGIVRGQPDINGSHPPKFANFHQAGYFGRAQGLSLLKRIQVVWEALPVGADVPRIVNPHRQPLLCELQFQLLSEGGPDILGSGAARV